jgi:hypothetical protein
MRTLEFYFSSPTDVQDKKLKWAPTPREWYEGFRDVLKISGYEITKSEIRQETNPRVARPSIKITVEGSKK